MPLSLVRSQPWQLIGGWPNGKAADFDSAHGGSTPSPPALWESIQVAKGR